MVNIKHLMHGTWKLLAPLFIAYKSHWLQGVDQLIVDCTALLESTPDLPTFLAAHPLFPKADSVHFQPYNLEPSLHYTYNYHIQLL